MVVSVDFINLCKCFSRSEVHLIRPSYLSRTRNSSHAYWWSLTRRRTCLKLCKAVLQWRCFSELIICTSIGKLASQRISDELTVIRGKWLRWGRWGHLSTLEAIVGSQFNSRWHSMMTTDVLSIWIKAKVRTIMCQYSSSVCWETHQLLKGTFCSSYCSSRGLRFL